MVKTINDLLVLFADKDQEINRLNKVISDKDQEIKRLNDERKSLKRQLDMLIGNNSYQVCK